MEFATALITPRGELHPQPSQVADPSTRNIGGRGGGGRERRKDEIDDASIGRVLSHECGTGFGFLLSG